MRYKMGSETITAKLLVAGATALLATTAAPAQDASFDQAAPVTLTVQMQTGESSVLLNDFLAKEFHALHPNVTVELQTISQDQKVGSNLTVLGSSNPPDVGMIPINSQVYTQLVNNEALLPIADVWDAADLRKRYSPSVASSLMPGGTPYTVAYAQVIYDVVWYNKEAFDAAGIEVPADHRIASLDALIEIAGKLKKANYLPLQLGGGSGYQASWMVDALLPTVANDEQMANYLQSSDPATPISANYTDPAFVTVLDALVKLNTAGIYQPGFLGQKAPDALAPFIAGKAGMALGGNFTMADFEKEKLPFTLDWLLLPPAGSGKTQQTLYFGDALGIPANAKNVEWAKTFLEFVMSDDVQQRGVVETASFLPSVNSLPPEALDTLDPLTRQLVEDIADNGARPGWTSTVPGGMGQQFLDPLIQQMYSGGLTPQDVAKQQQERLVSFRENGV